jgi:hypothetical protein
VTIDSERNFAALDAAIVGLDPGIDAARRTPVSRVPKKAHSSPKA